MTARRSSLAFALAASLLLTAAPALADDLETSAPQSPEDGPSALLAPAQSSDAEISPPGFFALDDRDTVQDRYIDEFWAGPVPGIGWTGSFGSCVAGSTNAAFRDATEDRINYYRDMAGVPSWVNLSGAFNGDAQAAALIMGAQMALSHTPPSTWQCWTQQGFDAAGESNIGIGTGYYDDNYGSWVPIHGPYAVDAYMEDFGASNYPVGHRRWLLCPQLQTMGTGDTTRSNAIKVLSNDYWDPRPSTREPYVAYPAPGHAPLPAADDRWSFSLDGAGFGSASVTMSARGQTVPVAIESVQNGFCENTIVWVPQWPFDPGAMGDLSVNVTISGITGPGASSYSYDLTLFDPGSPIRLSGMNRYETAAAVSYETWNPGVAVAYVATGGAFADALAAAGGPAGPILLTQGNSLPAATARELARLNPAAIYVLGGTGAVNNTVFQQVSAYGPTTRISGANRYETAAAVSAAFWSPGVDRAYVAVGTAFPDALAAGGGLPGPILLTDTATLPPATLAEIDRLNPTTIFVIGGTGAISNAVAAQLANHGPVTRLAGANRHETAAVVSAQMYPSGSDVVYIAYSGNFPDALAAAGGKEPGPILLTDTANLNAVTANEVSRLGAKTIIVVGGPGVVGPDPAWDLVALEQ